MGTVPIRDRRGGLLQTMRVLIAAIVGSVVLLAAPSGVRAGEPSTVWKDGWTINIPGQSNWVSNGTPSPFYLQSTPSTPYVPGSVKNPYGFADYSIGRTLGFGQELGLGNMQATLGVRLAEPLASNGFTPSFDPRRYLGTGPRMGLEGNQPLQSSWVVEWQVGAALLNGNRTFDTGGASQLASAEFRQQRFGRQCRWIARPVVLFDSVKRRSAIAPTIQRLVGVQHRHGGQRRVDHGPMVRFSIQK